MPRIKPEDAVIAWTPADWSHPTSGQIEVRARAADLNERWTDRYMCSGGAITTYHLDDARRNPTTYAYRWYVELTAEYNMDPKVVIKALSKIDGFKAELGVP